MGTTDRRLAALRDILSKQLKDTAIALASLDLRELPEPEPPPSDEQVRQWLLNIQHHIKQQVEAGRAIQRAVYCEPRMIAAAQAMLQRGGLRVQLEGVGAVDLVTPPEGYDLGSIEWEVAVAADAPRSTADMSCRAAADVEGPGSP